MCVRVCECLRMFTHTHTHTHTPQVSRMRKSLSQVQMDLERVRRAGGEGVALVYRCKQVFLFQK